MRLVIDIDIAGRIRGVFHSNFYSKIPVFLVFFLFFIFLTLMPFADAESRGRDPTLRSKLYEAFRCGNGICDTEIMENERTCPADCAEKPEAANAGNITQAALPEPKKKPTGLMPISTIVPSEEIYENYPGNYPAPAGEKSFVAESPSRVETEKESERLIFIINLFLSFLLAVIITGYLLRNKVPFFNETMKKFFGPERCSPESNEYKAKEKEFEQEIPAITQTSTLPLSVPQMTFAKKPKALLIIKKDRFMEGVSLLLSKLKKIRQQRQQKMLEKKQKEARDKSSSGIILSNMIDAFRRKGMSLKEIQQRIRRMGLWSEGTIKNAVEKNI